jgi:glycosyltransferase involved in cell wall biosynthesis
VDVTVHVIDDCSPDGSAAVVKALGESDDRIKVTLHGVNRGHIATYNEGLEQAGTDYVTLLSSDDGLPPGALARATALMEAHPSVGFVYGHGVRFDGPLPDVPDAEPDDWSVWPGRLWLDTRVRRGTNCVYSPEVVLRTSVQHDIGGYRSDMPHSGDFEMWMRAASVADVGRVNGTAQAFYRFHAASMQNTTFAGPVTDLRARAHTFEGLFGGAEFRSRVPDAPALLRRALATLAAEAVAHASRELESPAPDLELVRRYADLAREFDPSVTSRPAWRGLRARRAVAARFGSAVPYRVARPVTSLPGRLRWRRWRLAGL